MTTQKNKQIKQLGFEGIHQNTIITNKPIFNANKRGRKRHGALLVGDNWKIESDCDLNLTLFHRSEKSWRPVGYFLTLSGALGYLINSEIRKSDLSDLENAVGRIEELKRQIFGLASNLPTLSNEKST